ncbi:MAG TPA: hypothetical protein VM451_04070 [Candidatus Limnocylindria bacterium]|nr:hypothetical protein [Candidatus Limnocylindria bacterium]
MSRHACEIEPADGATKLTVTSFGLTPKLASEFTTGMVWIVSGLKTFLEEGRVAVSAG